MQIGSDDERWMADALEVAAEGLAAGELPVGAIVVADGEIVGRAHAEERAQARLLVHAELLALDRADRTPGWDRTSATLYTTVEPCLLCLGAAATAMVGRVAFAVPAPSDGAARFAQEWQRQRSQGLAHVEVPTIVEGAGRVGAEVLLGRFLATRPDPSDPMAGWVRSLLRPTPLETRTVVICGDCAAFWDPDAEAAACTDPTHEHHRYDSHLHRSPVTFPDGTTVMAVSYGSADPYRREVPPDFGLYLDDRWQPPWPHVHLAWPDFGVPDDLAPARESLENLRRRAQAGQRVELGCYGAHGRTGTALACLAVRCGVGRDRAIDWIRAVHCERAIETGEQAALVERFWT